MFDLLASHVSFLSCSYGMKKFFASTAFSDHILSFVLVICLSDCLSVFLSGSLSVMFAFLSICVRVCM